MMCKNILLVNPWIYDFSAYDLWVKPLGLLYIASILRKNNYNVRLIDCLNPNHFLLQNEPHIKVPKRNTTGHGKFPKEEISKPYVLAKIKRRYKRYGITPAILIEELRLSPLPDLILITSMMSYWYTGVFDVIKIAKQIFPGVPVALGGIYVTLCPEHALKSGADFIISGEGEQKVLALLEKLFGNKTVFIPDANNLDSIPYPAFDLLPVKEQYPILTSRGCPYNCTYCASHLLHMNFRQRDPINVVDEISFWQKNEGIKHFAFYDDALLVNPEEMAIPMLEEIIQRNLSCQFHCPNGLHLSEITGKMCKLLQRAGFRTIRFGFESSNISIQIDTGGKVNNEQLTIAVRYLKEAGYKSHEIGVYLLCGLPGQDAAEMLDSIRYVKSCGARPIIAEYSPIPGTALWESAVNSSPFDIKGEPLFHNNSLLPCQSEKLTFEMYQELKLITRMR